MTRLRDEKIEKLCPQCGIAMWVVDVIPFGRLWQCGDCKASMLGDRLYPWRQQIEDADQTIDVRSMRANKHRSMKPCPECSQLMWAIVEEGYGTRHQCEECRLTVMFGGAISRWRNIPKDKSPDEIEAARL
jgi:DNA-directed RNA polymerase subunit M/transcription elongation factor TFIIS